MNLLKGYRARLGISQAELANRVGVSRESIRLYEAGKQEPKAHFFYALCAQLLLSETEKQDLSDWFKLNSEKT